MRVVTAVRLASGPISVNAEAAAPRTLPFVSFSNSVKAGLTKPRTVPRFSPDWVARRLDGPSIPRSGQAYNRVSRKLPLREPKAAMSHDFQPAEAKTMSGISLESSARATCSTVRRRRCPCPLLQGRRLQRLRNRAAELDGGTRDVATHPASLWSNSHLLPSAQITL